MMKIHMEFGNSQVADIGKLANKPFNYVKTEINYDWKIFMCIEETPSHELKRIEVEKTALSLFANGVSYDIVRRSISEDLVDNERLTDIQRMALKQAKK